MPDFIPPLGQTSTVDLLPRDHPASSTSFVHLSFFATFTHDEDSSGSWEIWTDLPQTDNGHITAEGQWHTLRFEKYDGPPQDAPSPIIQGYRPLTYRATSSFPATPDKSYGYTFRRVFDSGETHWLGGEGSNGIISLRPMTQTGTSSVPIGSIDGIQGGRWEGLALELESGRPTVQTLPSTQGLSPILTILTTTLPDHSADFSSVSSDNNGRPASPKKLHTISIGKSLIPFHLDPNTFLSHADVARESGAKPLFFNLESVIADASAKDTLVPISSYTFIGGSGYGAIYYSPNTDPIKYLVVYAAASTEERVFKVGPPEQSSTAFAVILSDTQTFLLSGEAQVPFAFAPGGTIAQLYKVCELSELRGAGSDDSILICAPDATSIEDGEEEIDIPHTEPKAAAPEVPSLASASLITTDVPSTIETPDDDAPVTEFTEATPELEDSFDASSDVSPHDRELAPAPPGLWFFKLIGRFLFGVLDWLITASKPRIETIEAATPKMSEAADEPEAMTPADHSPDLPRSSSGTFSNLTSPLLDTLKLPSQIITPVAEIGNPLDSRDDDAQTITAGTVQIRSYTQFTFNKAPPFRFLLAPGTVGIGSKLRFMLGRKGGQWIRVEPTVSPDHDGCVEARLAGSVDGSGDWEVQVERT